MEDKEFKPKCKLRDWKEGEFEKWKEKNFDKEFNLSKKIRKEALRRLLIINEDFGKKQNNKIESLQKQLEFMIKERNKYKEKYFDFISLKNQLKKVTQEKNKLAIAYAKEIGVLKHGR